MDETPPSLDLDPAGIEARARERLDRFLTAALEVTRAEARRLLEDGAVTLNGRPVGREAKSRPIATADRVVVRPLSGGSAGDPLPEPEVPLAVLEATDAWIAVDKPAGRAVHPYRRGERGSVLGALAAREPRVVGVGEGGLRSGVVHRLDVQTSGVLLFALRDEVYAAARRAFEGGGAAKRYRALVSGSLVGEGELALDLYVARHRPARVRVAAPGSGVRTWRTTLRWKALASGPDATLVEVTPRTGFLHQIRVAMAELGHPVLGDATYGAADGEGSAPGDPGARHYLHAASLAIPSLGIRAESPDPEDFRARLERAIGPAGAESGAPG